MTFPEYLAHFESILNQQTPTAPYDNPDYLEYTKLNWSRMQRWQKTGIVTPALQELLTVDKVQEMQWIVITEPWCGDAAHTVPFIHLAAANIPNIQVRYELRDAEPYRINRYLTNGSKSIPKLIIQDAQGNDLAVWGPRPAMCQQVYNELVANKADFETIKTELQHWYNKDKGLSFQEELVAVLRSL